MIGCVGLGAKDEAVAGVGVRVNATRQTPTEIGWWECGSFVG